MVDYQKITELFGAPLDSVPKPHTTFKLKSWHVVTGVIVLGFMSYGLYAAHRDIKLRFNKKVP
jgi:hypothetical protein